MKLTGFEILLIIVILVLVYIFFIGEKLVKCQGVPKEMCSGQCEWVGCNPKKTATGSTFCGMYGTNSKECIADKNCEWSGCRKT